MLSDKELAGEVFAKAESISGMLWDAARAKDVDEHVIAAGLATCINLLSAVLQLLLEECDDEGTG